jgi:hypothetical protein
MWRGQLLIVLLGCGYLEFLSAYQVSPCSHGGLSKFIRLRNRSSPCPLIPTKKTRAQASMKSGDSHTENVGPSESGSRRWFGKHLAFNILAVGCTSEGMHHFLWLHTQDTYRISSLTFIGLLWQHRMRKSERKKQRRKIEQKTTHSMHSPRAASTHARSACMDATRRKTVSCFMPILDTKPPKHIPVRHSDVVYSTACPCYFDLIFYLFIFHSKRDSMMHEHRRVVCFHISPD